MSSDTTRDERPADATSVEPPAAFSFRVLAAAGCCARCGENLRDPNNAAGGPHTRDACDDAIAEVERRFDEAERRARHRVNVLRAGF